MVKYFFTFLICLGIFSCSTSNENEPPNEIIKIQNEYGKSHIIPAPHEIDFDEGFFTLNNETCIKCDDRLETETTYLKNLIEENSTFKLNAKGTSSIELILTESVGDTITNPEAYSLKISKNEILIQGCSPSGIMRGIQTLRQLFVVDFHEGLERNVWYLPALSIIDFPKFQHRGMLLDVCRHFFDKDVVLKYIDVLAFYKMNVLHFHLTEDQGWRIPIEKYPMLTEIGAWRKDSSGNLYGGFYTKEELKEIVAFAAERHITVIPEIELPGHAQAALAAYPQFSCTGGPIDVVNDWGVFKEIYCAGNDSTFIFIEDILTEVMEIFPSEYIHIGGDEAPKFRWEQCKKCQKRMKDEGLENEHGLQSYFITRIEKFLNKNGRQLIGWDEILEGGLSPNATVQSWRGVEGGIQAAESKHQVIMSPTSHCYLDYGLSSIDLEKIYNFDPIPEELNRNYHQYIIGGEGNMWTEHVPTENDLDSKVFPRIIGLAEVLWSYNPHRDYNEFYQRLQGHYEILKALGINYGLETIGASISVEKGKIILTKNLQDLSLKYKWNDGEERNYSEPLELKLSGTLSVQAYKKGEKYGVPITQKFAKHKGIGGKVIYKNDYNEWYTAGGTSGLVDGKLGSLDFRDGNWQGFWGSDLDVIIELDSAISVNEIELNFYQYANAWVFKPTSVLIGFRKDKNNLNEWEHVKGVKVEGSDLSNEKSIANIKFEKINQDQVKYILIQAKNIGQVPEDHEAAGSDAWVFIDEIIIK